MKFVPTSGSRALAVVSGAAILTAAAAGGAVAKSMVTSHDIKNGTIHAIDMATDSANSRVIGDGAVHSKEIRDGSVHSQDLQKNLLDKLKQPAYVGPNWSIIDRNVIGNGDAYLRTGPSSAGALGNVTPPSGVGSLGLRTGSGSDKVAFGDQVDLAGRHLGGIHTVSFYVFTTGENNQISTSNLPSVEFEVNPNTGGSTFSTLVYVPTAAASNTWTKLDASTAQQWYYTGGFGTTSGCNQTTYCTLADAEAAAPDATIYSVEINKGRDFAFSGAVDDLQLNGTVYDFEPSGVIRRPAH